MTLIANTLNKIHVRTFTGSKSITNKRATPNKEVCTFSEITVQADKALKISVYANFATAQYSWSGIYPGMSIKVNGTWYDCGDRGYTVAMYHGSGGAQSYTDIKYIDLIEEGIVNAGGDYTIEVMVLTRTYDSSGIMNDERLEINGDNMGNHGTPLVDVMEQNFISVIVEEKDRWA